MSVLIISTHSLSRGPTTVGDQDSDPLLMASLGATRKGKRYKTNLTVRVVLRKLVGEGYRVVGMAGASEDFEQKWVWTLLRDW